MAEWYWMKDGKKQGPVDTAHLKQLARAGQIQPADMIWRDGLPNWVPASQASGLEFGPPQRVLSSHRSGPAATRAPAAQPGAVSHGIIKYRCARCGAALESEGRLAGKQDTCPSCGKATAVPMHSTVGSGAFFRRIPKSISIGAAAFVLLAVASLAAWLALRDTWERDHGAELRRLGEQTIELLRAGKNDAGVAKYESLLAFLGQRQLEDPQLRQVLADAKHLAEPARQQLQEQRRQAELKRREVENLAKLQGLESQAKAFLQAGDLRNGIDKCQQALEFVRTSQTDNPAFAQAIRRLTDMKAGAEGQVASAETERKLQEQSLAQAEHALGEAKLMEQRQDYRQAVEKYQEVVDIIKNRNVRSESSGQMLVQAEAGKKRSAAHLSFTISVKIINVHLTDAVPRWSVEHELRVNGRVVDTMTNTSTIVDFSDIEVKVGDKVTARSMWKNAYGAVGTVFVYAPDWPIADIGKTSYTVLLYEDEVSYRVKEKMRKEGRE